MDGRREFALLFKGSLFERLYGGGLPLHRAGKALIGTGDRACATGVLGPLRQQGTIDPLIGSRTDAFAPVRCLAVKFFGAAAGSRAFNAPSPSIHPRTRMCESAQWAHSVGFVVREQC